LNRRLLFALVGAVSISLFVIARRMGTSLEQIDKTYGHLLPDAEAAEREMLNAFDSRESDAVRVEK